MNNKKILVTLITAVLGTSAFAQQTTAATNGTQAALTQGVDLYVDGVKTLEGVMAYSSNLITFKTEGQHTVALVQHGTNPGIPGNTLMSSSYMTAKAQTTVKLNVTSDYGVLFY